MFVAFAKFIACLWLLGTFLASVACQSLILGGLILFIFIFSLVAMLRD